MIISSNPFPPEGGYDSYASKFCLITNAQVTYETGDKDYKFRTQLLDLLLLQGKSVWVFHFSKSGFG